MPEKIIDRPSEKSGNIVSMASRALRILLFGILAGLPTEVHASNVWTRLEGCVLVQSPYNDADSFRVRHDGKEYLFRLYFVDAPESDMEFPQRVREQAEYFGITAPEVIESGKEASSFVKSVLSPPFTVITRWQGAQGRSVIPRFYAFVETRDGDLAELLVRNGFARVYGVRVTRPDGRRATDYRATLLQMEDQARRQKLGAWARSRPLSEQFSRAAWTDLPVIAAPRPVSIYTKELPRRRLVELKRDSAIRLVEEFADGWVHVIAENHGVEVEGVCLRWDLSLPDPIPGEAAQRIEFPASGLRPR